jgi:hypothetical protein
MLRNLFYGTLRRNLRRFNKTRKDDEKISGDFLELMKIREIREILTVAKDFPMKSVWRNKKLSRKTLEMLENINGEGKCNESEEKNEESTMNTDSGLMAKQNIKIFNLEKTEENLESGETINWDSEFILKSEDFEWI